MQTPCFHLTQHLSRLASLLALAISPLLAHAAEPALDLAATGWELVAVQSMDDSRFAPAANDKGRYKMVFNDDGSVAVEAGCNRATTSLQPLLPPRLRFTEIAGTRAKCPPPSVSERFLQQLSWVRSYVTRDGHLYLATAADASILEFRPLTGEGVSARIAGLSIASDNVDTVRATVLAQAMNIFAREQGIDASDAEVEALLEIMEREQRAALGDDYTDGSELSPRERGELAAMRYGMANALIRNWKINAALHAKYGGRLIYQQFGPEPVDAYVALLREQENKGALQLLDEGLVAPFWSYFADENRHDVMPPGGEDERNAFSSPPWQAQAQ
ncbi:META domain-containing protein [Pseudohalioglobus sediminis]|uniref:META domain-containing protein n=1 Tax=Pseudohalioglobus sediminis TaxID=2606449 RepID=A0A5B0WZN8_9GAMM|nr:META domain-containing protein [Pseudohalioglobus sediminis]KAA1191818.1 META domain-containing protein [Pseudohalioglobus sediminis]